MRAGELLGQDLFDLPNPDYGSSIEDIVNRTVAQNQNALEKISAEHDYTKHSGSSGSSGPNLPDREVFKKAYMQAVYIKIFDEVKAAIDLIEAQEENISPKPDPEVKPKLTPQNLGEKLSQLSPEQLAEVYLNCTDEVKAHLDVIIPASKEEYMIANLSPEFFFLMKACNVKTKKRDGSLKHPLRFEVEILVAASSKIQKLELKLENELRNGEGGMALFAEVEKLKAHFRELVPDYMTGKKQKKWNDPLDYLKKVYGSYLSSISGGADHMTVMNLREIDDRFRKTLDNSLKKEAKKVSHYFVSSHILKSV